eukprot:2667385-Rhodomonas_salina.1
MDTNASVYFSCKVKGTRTARFARQGLLGSEPAGGHPLREDDLIIEVAFEGFRGPPAPILLDDALHHSCVEQVSRPSSVHAVRGEQSW